jgi:L-2,4-diaminobutyrate decarboxylase
LFEIEFLTSSDKSKDAYRQWISQAIGVVCDSFPARPYGGKDATALARLAQFKFLPEGQTANDLGQFLHTMVANSIAASDPATIAHLHCPPLLPALAAEVVISALNQSMDSFDQAPIATVVEQKLIRWLCSEAGYPASADGTFTTGGSLSNYMGLLLARDSFIERTWNWSAQKCGLPTEAAKLRILCSEVSHFTVEKSASQLGLGTDAVVRVSVDEHFRMDPGFLREALQHIRSNGLVPMAIVGTAGTTDFGSIDPLTELAAIAKSEKTWLHVDAAYGGALLFSTSHHDKLAGIELADSLSVDFHKLFWQPIPCSAFLLRDSSNFRFIRMHADYLNPETHEEEGVPNLVTNSVLTSRRFDALKLWISLQSLGRNKLGAMIDRTIALASHAAEVVRRIPNLELVAEPQLSTMVFRYVPSSGQGNADMLNATIRKQLFDGGAAVLGHTRVKGVQCLKLTCMNPSLEEFQLELLLSEIAKTGQQLESKNHR